MRAKEVLASLSLAIALAACGQSANEGTSRVSVGPYVFDIPSYNAQVIGRSPAFYIDYLAGTDEGNGVTLIFSNDSLAEAIDGYQNPQTNMGKSSENFIVGVSYLSAEEKQRYRRLGADNMADLFLGQGDFQGREIEKLDGTSMYRVFPFPESRRSWQVVSGHPTLLADPFQTPGFWVAACRKGQGTHARCSARMMIEDMNILLSLPLTEPNLSYRDQVVSFIREKLRSWQSANGPAS